MSFPDNQTSQHYEIFLNHTLQRLLVSLASLEATITWSITSGIRQVMVRRMAVSMRETLSNMR